MIDYESRLTEEQKRNFDELIHDLDVKPTVNEVLNFVAGLLAKGVLGK